MTRKKKQDQKKRSLQIETLNHRIMLDGAGLVDAVFHGPSPYLSEADTPADFVPVPDCDDCVVGLETFEDSSLDFGLLLSTGEIIGPGFSTGSENLTDSVDGDDGDIDGTGQTNDGGYSYFTFENSITVTLPSLMQSAGLVWTDGDPGLTDVVFEAFDEAGNSLGMINAGPIADDSVMGTTAEDRFFGVSYGDGVTTGVTSIVITNVGGSGIEIDHIQFTNCSACCNIDLELNKSVDASIVEAGDTVIWTIEVTNNPDTGTASATGVQIGDVLPAGVTVAGASVTNGSFSPGTGLWTLSGPLDPGEVETLTISTTIDAGLTGGTMLQNVAQIIAADQTDIDSTPNNDDGDQSEDDEDSAKVTVAEPVVIDLELSKDVNATVVESGENVTWSITTTNNAANATADATGVTITDVLPAGLSLVSATPSGNGTFLGNTWTLVDPLEPGASQTLTLVTSVDAGLAGGTMLVNTAYVETANENDVDSNPGDNDLAEDDADDAKITIASIIDLELIKTVDSSLVQTGSTVNWTLTLLNNDANANADATSVVVSDVLPAGVTLVNATPSGSTQFTDDEWIINEAISPGEVLTLNLETTVDATADGTIVNVAQVIAADQTDIDSMPNNDDGDQSEDDEDGAQIVVEVPTDLLMLSGFSYVDTNNDGIFQTLELPLLGVEVQLMGTDAAGNTVSHTTFTDINGFYKFNDLQPGTYMVEQTQPVQFLDGKDTLGNLGGEDDVNDKFTVDLTNNAVEYNFGELGLRPEFVNKRLYLTSTPYTEWQYIDVRESSIWYSFDLEHQSFLDINAVVPTGGSATVTIFDGNMDPVAVQAFGTSNASADPIPLTGNTYYMQVSGNAVIESLSLEITTPNVSVNGHQLVAVGTAGDDNIQLHLGTSEHVLDFNGLTYYFDADIVTDIHIGAATGEDSVTVVGTDLDDTGSVLDGNGELTSSDYSVHTYAFDDTSLVGGGGTDHSQIYGSYDDDELAALPNDTTLTTPDGVMHMVDFDRVDAYGRGGNDYGALYGTQGDDLYIARDAYTLLTGEGFMAYTKDFERVDAFGRGGVDMAELHDSAGNDTFVSTDVYASMRTSTRYTYTKDFETVNAKSIHGGTDAAHLFNLDESDEISAANADAVVTRPSPRVENVEAFDHVYAYGEGAGPQASIDGGILFDLDTIGWTL